MQSRLEKMLKALTDTGAKRLGLSCAVLGICVASALAIGHFDETHLRRIGNDNVQTERAEQLGLGVEPMRRQIRFDCEKRFGVDPFIVQNCMNAELFGDFGIAGERAYSLMKIKYAFGSAGLAVLAGLVSWLFGWVLIAIAHPACRSYWSWLRGG